MHKVVIASLLFLFGCGEAAPRYTISKETGSQLFANATHREITQDTEFIALTCTLSEGFFCYYLPAPQLAVFVATFDPQLHTDEHRLAAAVSDNLLQELDPKRVEHAKNNTILIKCQRSAHIQCTINGGTEEVLGIR